MASSFLANRVRVATATSGTGTVTLGAKVSNKYATFAEAGITDGQVVTYTIEDGNDWEIGRGTYTAAGTTLSRDTVLISSVAGTVGTSKLNLSGAAEVFISAAKEDLDVNDFTEDAAPDLAADFGWTYDTSAGLKKKTLLRRHAGGIAPSTQASTSGTAIDFGSIPAGTKRIEIMFNGVSLSGTDNFLVQIGDVDGLETTGYVSGSGDSTFVGSTAGFIMRSAGATRVWSGMMVLTLLTGTTWIASHGIGTSTSASGVGGGGTKALSAELDRLRITVTGSDTFDAGEIGIRYWG